jgi:integrase
MSRSTVERTVRPERSWRGTATMPARVAERVALGDDWLLWRDFAVRSAGFPVDGLDVFGLGDESARLRGVARDPAFRESFRKDLKSPASFADWARITLHECRHTFASLMIAAGVNAKALCTFMGHASITITLDRYGHLMPGNEDEAVALVDAYLEHATVQSGLRRSQADT